MIGVGTQRTLTILPLNIAITIVIGKLVGNEMSVAVGAGDGKQLLHNSATPILEVGDIVGRSHVNGGVDERPNVHFGIG
nr:hypothetical protein Itr_chr05CG25440 [Ipomoea trifida]GMD02492.1 hypothetical protein Iba_chr05fCG17050 [Ipomoea batatas]